MESNEGCIGKLPAGFSKCGMLDSAIQAISFEASFSVPNLRSKLNWIHGPAAQVTEHDSNSKQQDAVQLQERTDSKVVWER